MGQGPIALSKKFTAIIRLRPYSTAGKRYKAWFPSPSGKNTPALNPFRPRGLSCNGAGKPGSIPGGCRNLGIEIRGTKFFPDHYWLKPKDWIACIEEARRKNAGAIIITEKDAVKISHPPDFPLLVSVQSTEVSNAQEFEHTLKKCAGSDRDANRDLCGKEDFNSRNKLDRRFGDLPSGHQGNPASFSGAHISLLVRPWVRDIYSAVDSVDEILEYDKNGRHRGLIGFRRLISDLRNRRIDMAILLQNAFEAAFIAWCARIPKRIGYARDGRSLLLTDCHRY